MNQRAVDSSQGMDHSEWAQVFQMLVSQELKTDLSAKVIGQPFQPGAFEVQFYWNLMFGVSIVRSGKQDSTYPVRRSQQQETGPLLG